MNPNRIVAALTAACGLAGALAVPLANLDTSSTIGVLGGLGTLTAAAVTWLSGWQKHEQRLHETELYANIPVNDGELDGDDEHPAVFGVPQTDPAKVPPDEGDPGQPTAKPKPPARKRPARKAAK